MAPLRKKQASGIPYSVAIGAEASRVRLIPSDVLNSSSRSAHVSATDTNIAVCHQNRSSTIGRIHKSFSADDAAWLTGCGGNRYIVTEMPPCRLNVPSAFVQAATETFGESSRLIVRVPVELRDDMAARIAFFWAVVARPMNCPHRVAPDGM
jgi:hypothetical protein